MKDDNWQNGCKLPHLLFLICINFKTIHIQCYLFIRVQTIMSSISSRSPSRRKQSSHEKVENHKWNSKSIQEEQANEQELQSELKLLFSKYGPLDSLVVKKSRNQEYCFGFVEYQLSTEGEEAVRNLNNYQVRGKPMKVELQDNSKRRKDPDKGCYNCGRMGHFARECRNKTGYRKRSRSRSRSRSKSYSYDRHRKHRRRNRSDSSDYSHHKKSRKHRSKDRRQKKKKKHKKSRHRSSSESYS